MNSSRIIQYIVICMVDLAVIGTFGFLAYHFNYWWIMLFSVLCLLVWKDNEE